MKSVLSITLLITILTGQSISQNLTLSPTIFDDLYQSSNKPVLKIQTDVKTLLKKKMKEEYQPGRITLYAGSEKEIEMTIKLRARGNMRKRQCKLPPLKIDFDKADLLEMGLDSVDKIKLVLQCRNNQDNINYMIKERLIYDLYALIDPLHIKTKLVSVQLWDKESLELELEGFIVEDEEQYAHRTGAKVIESGNVRSGSLERGHYMKMIFFQYMIANTDWAIPNKHNVEMVAHSSKSRVMAIPYDFDYSGFVGTPYAVPHETLPIKKVTDRHFRGFEVKENEAKATAAYFKSKEEEFYAVIDNCSYCDADIKKESKEFIKPFFSTIKSDRRVTNIMVTAQH